MSVGEQIRKQRIDKGLTLNQVAQRSGLTIGGLSRIERGLVAPTMPTVQRIAVALGAPVFQLFMETEPGDRVIVRKSLRRTLKLAEGDASYEIISPSSRRQFEAIRFTLEPGAATSREQLPHQGEELCLVLSGDLRFELADRVYELASGDAAQYDSGIPHRFVNHTEVSAEALFVSSPPF